MSLVSDTSDFSMAKHGKAQIEYVHSASTLIANN